MNSIVGWNYKCVYATSHSDASIHHDCVVIVEIVGS